MAADARPPQTTGPVASFDAVSHRYGPATALDAISLDIPAGVMAGIIGPDGVGKSTVLALLTGVRRLQTGRVAALGGDEVCVHAGRLLINGLPTANLLQMDHEGRELPRPAGCRRIGSEEVLLLGDHPKSLDGRYFSAQERGRIIGKASAIWKTGASDDP